MKKIRLIVVDDSATIRQLFTSILSAEPDIEVVATAEDPYDAREKIKQFNPDLITLDVEMPKMDGLSFLEKIMTLRPMPVIMASTLTTRGADITLRALETGAVDYIAKPQAMAGNTFQHFREELVHKVRSAAAIRLRAPVRKAPANVVPFHGPNHSQLIAIGASTGGVEALRDILVHLPANAPAIVITQHMPQVFTASFAQRINTLSPMQVQEAAQDMPIHPGNVYIAAGGLHFEVRQQGRGLTCHLHDGPQVSGHKPSVDVLFHSVARVQGRKLVGAILTGMGHDGAEGLRAMHDTGAFTLGQNEASCTIYGMPKAAKAAGGVDREVPLADMPREILNACIR